MIEGEESFRDPAGIAAAISEQIVAIHSNTCDLGVQFARTYLTDDLVVAVLQIKLSMIEQRVVESGRGDLVHALRDGAQKAGAASLEAVVERTTGRRVVGFSSHTHLDESPFVIELFVLGPSRAYPAEPQ